MTAGSLVQAYRIVFAALIAVASIATLASHEHGVAFFAGVEIAGALLFVWRRIQIIGAILLLLVFASAEAVAIAQGQFQMHFLQYAAATLAIVLLDRRARGPV